MLATSAIDREQQLIMIEHQGWRNWRDDWYSSSLQFQIPMLVWTDATSRLGLMLVKEQVLIVSSKFSNAWEHQLSIKIVATASKMVRIVETGH